jgi:hypothetical protein
MRRWAKPKVRGPAGQLALAFDGRATIAEPARIDTMPVASGVVDTSREAAAAGAETAARNRRLILQIVTGAGVRGVTLDEVSAATGKPPNQISGRFTDLERLGLIARSGERRKTRTGREAHVWVTLDRTN